MDLEEFVASSIEQIIAGVMRAKEKVAAEMQGKARVNPRVASGSLPNRFATVSAGSDVVQFVDFDVAVTASKGQAGQAGGGIRVAGIEIGGGREKTQEDSVVSRIKFWVPISFSGEG